MRITVIGTGFVGLSNALIFSKKNAVIVYDSDKSKVDLINKGQLPLPEEFADSFFLRDGLALTATNCKYTAFSDADFVVISVPTDFDVNANSFNTDLLEKIITDVISHTNKSSVIVVRSTVPVGFTERVSNKLDSKDILYSPDFLGEYNTVSDSIYPSRIIVGEKSHRAETFAGLIFDAAEKENIPVIYTSSTEAEAIKLFTNAYLSMRVAFFNELDSFAYVSGLSSLQIITGVCSDPRVGHGYNNPSFGSGAGVENKDTKQLRSSCSDNPNDLIRAIVNSNETRIDFIAESIIKLKPYTVGFYGLAVNSEAGNFLHSSTVCVMNIIKSKGVEVIIYDPKIDGDEYLDAQLIRNLDLFKMLSDVIVTQRMVPELKNVCQKVYTRDILDTN